VGKPKLVSPVVTKDVAPTDGDKRQSASWWRTAVSPDSADVKLGSLSGQQSLTIGLVIAASTAWLGHRYWKS
jgi:hypothetical protein